VAASTIAALVIVGRRKIAPARIRRKRAESGEVSCESLGENGVVFMEEERKKKKGCFGVLVTCGF
jgi:hypothetical protein